MNLNVTSFILLASLVTCIGHDTARYDPWPEYM